MGSIRSPEVLSELVRLLGKAGLQAISSYVVSPWKELYIRTYHVPDEPAPRIELYVQPMAGPPLGLRTTRDIDAIVNEMWDLKDQIFDPPWHGFKMVVTRDGQGGMEFLYDPPTAAPVPSTARN